MTKYLFVIIFIFQFLSVNAQISVTTSEEEKLIKGKVPEIFHYDDNGYLTYLVSGKKIYLKGYSINNGVISSVFSTEYEMYLPGYTEYYHRNGGLEQAYLIGDKIMLFYDCYDANKNHFTLRRAELDSETGKQIGDDVLMYSKEAYNQHRYDFNIDITPDRSQVLIKKPWSTSITKSSYITYHLLDSDMEELFVIELEKDYGYLPDNFILDNDASVYYVNYKEDSKKIILGSYDANKDYELWEEEVVLPLESSNNFEVQNLSQSVTPSKDVVVVGTFSQTTTDNEKLAKKGSLSGCFRILIDHVSKEVKDIKVNYFEKAFFDQFLTLKDKQNNDLPYTYNYFPNARYYFERDNIIVSLEYYKRDYNFTSEGVFLSEIKRYYDAILLKFNHEGKLIWANRINKKQSAFRGSVGGSVKKLQRINIQYSFITSITEDEVQIIFNDLPQNFKNKGPYFTPKLLNNPEESISVIQHYDISSGELKRYELLDDFNNKKISICPYYQFTSNGDQNKNILSISLGKSKYKFVLFK